MGVVDIILLCCFIPALYTGATQGFIRQLASIIAIFAGAYIAYKFSYWLSAYITDWFKAEGDIVTIISFVLIFIAVLIAVNIMGAALRKIMSFALLGWLDKNLGIIFSVLKTVLILSVLIFLLEKADSLWPMLPEKAIAESKLYPAIAKIAPALFPYLKGLF